MEDGFSLGDSTVGIVGLGLMGGSLAMALKGKCARLIGFDSHSPTLELAISHQIVDDADSDPAGHLSELDLLILATPVPAILDLINRLPITSPHPCILLDLGSTKRDITRAMSALPANFDPLGGHPICGREKLGLENASADLYQGAPFIITPLERTTYHAIRITKQLIAAIGATFVEMTAEDHDRILASTSHLPFLLSSALAHVTPRGFAPFIGPGFRSTARLAGTPSHMMMGILRSNRENVLNALHGMQNQLAELESALSSEDFIKLESLLNEAQSTYHSITGN